MQFAILRDYGAPLESAASISGMDLHPFRTRLFRGLLGPTPSEPLRSASFRYVAAALAITEATRLGIGPDRLAPVHDQLADSAYVRLAMLELGLRRWHSATAGSNLAEKIRSGEAKGVLEEMLGVQTRNTKRWALFPGETGAYMSDDLPEPDSIVRIDSWRMAELIQARAPGTLFY